LLLLQVRVRVQKVSLLQAQELQVFWVPLA
jgi:hypothetical protein